MWETHFLTCMWAVGPLCGLTASPPVHKRLLSACVRACACVCARVCICACMCMYVCCKCLSCPCPPRHITFLNALFSGNHAANLTSNSKGFGTKIKSCFSVAVLSGGNQGKCTKLTERPRELLYQAVRVESCSVPVVRVPEIFQRGDSQTKMKRQKNKQKQTNKNLSKHF